MPVLALSRPVKKLAAAVLFPFLYLLACAFWAAVAAYPIYILFGNGDAGFFRSLVGRGGQAFLILGLFPMVRTLGLRTADLGLQRDFPRQFGIGWVLGILMLLVHLSSLVVLEVRAVNEWVFRDGGRLLSILVKATVTGATVALLEETIFRGVLFAALRKLTGAWSTVVISAFYFAALHFIRARWTPDPAEIGWGTAFRVVIDGFAQLANLPVDSFLALFLAGILLGVIRAGFPRGLGYCMGLHAGWVLVIKSAKPLVREIPDADWGFLVSSYDRFIGFLSAGWMALLILGFVFFTRGRTVRDEG